MVSEEDFLSFFCFFFLVNPYLAFRDNSRAGGGLPTQKPVILTIYHMQPFRASVLIQE